MKIAWLFAAVRATAALPAKAAIFNFSYVAEAFDLSGQITGTVSPNDSNIVLVSSVDSVTFNGVAHGAIAFVSTVGTLIRIDPGPARFSFDGSEMALLGCPEAGCPDGSAIVFDNSPMIIPYFSGIPVVGTNYDEDIILVYSADNWTLTAASVPDTASWALLLTGFGLTGARLRDRRRAGMRIVAADGRNYPRPA